MRIKQFSFYLLVLIVLALTVKLYLISEVFLPSIATAVVLAYLTTPVYGFLFRRSKRPTLSALAVIFFLIALILVPSVLIIMAIQPQLVMLFSPNTLATAQNLLLSIQDFAATRLHIALSLSDVFPRLVPVFQSIITSIAPKLIFSITGFLLSAFLTFFLMFYLLIYSGGVIAVLKRYFPLSDRNTDTLLDQMGSSTRSLILGHFLIALIQGILGGIGFLIFGIPGALLWSAIMTVFSFIPMLGAFLVWFPAGIILISTGNYFSGIGILAWGFLLVSTIDNILRPKLTSALGKIHPVTVLLGAFIGLNEWGFIGLVLGPLLITVLMLLICMLREEYIEEQ
jgi:predicted PurR-regulated permease PerM